MHNKPGKSMAWAGRKGQNLLQIESWCQLSSSFRKARDNGSELGQAWKTSWYRGSLGVLPERAAGPVIIRRVRPPLLTLSPLLHPPRSAVFLEAQTTKPGPSALEGEQGKKRKWREGWERGGSERNPSWMRYQIRPVEISLFFFFF